jgi:hypothetical protein
MRQLPTRLNIWFNVSGEWRYQGQVALAGDQIIILPVDVGAGEELELAGMVDHAWVAAGPPARRAFVRIVISFLDGAARHVHAEETDGELLPDEAQPAPLAQPAARVSIPAHAIPAPAVEPVWLEKLRRLHGIEWLKANWQRLKAEWAYIQSL